MVLLANAGVPMLFVYAPVLALAFIPILMIETPVTALLLGKREVETLGPVLAANLVSTVVGVPLTWLVLVVAQMATGGGRAMGAGLHAVTWQAPWLVPYEGDLGWMIPAAGLALCAPFYVASAWVEAIVLGFIWKDMPRSRIRRSCWIANACSYAVLSLVWVIWLVCGLMSTGPNAGTPA